MKATNTNIKVFAVVPGAIATDVLLGSTETRGGLKRLTRQAVMDCRSERVVITGTVMGSGVDGMFPVSSAATVFSL
ncbi:MAG: hypothetical protein ACLQF0_05590 [Dissulfurispiraceae bacterium]